MLQNSTYQHRFIIRKQTDFSNIHLSNNRNTSKVYSEAGLEIWIDSRQAPQIIQPQHVGVDHRQRRCRFVPQHARLLSLGHGKKKTLLFFFQTYSRLSTKITILGVHIERPWNTNNFGTHKQSAI
jgi:hypothetical protein